MMTRFSFRRVKFIRDSRASRHRESIQRVSVKHLRLPGVAVPCSVGVAENLSGDNYAKAKYLIHLYDSIVNHLAIRADCELDGSGQFSVAQDFHFIIAR